MMLGNSSDRPRKKYFVTLLENFFNENVCSVYSLEPPRSYEFTHLPLLYRRPEFAFRPVVILTVSGSNYAWLEHIFMVPKMFEPLRFDCTYSDLDWLQYLVTK